MIVIKYRKTLSPSQILALPLLTAQPIPIKKRFTYKAACLLVAAIDSHLSRGTKNYYNKQGVLLRTLEQVINAILDNNLAMGANENE